MNAGDWDDDTGLRLAGLACGSSHPPLIVAELSGNHGGNLNLALEMIDSAASAGADLIKIQTYTPDTITIDCDRPEFRIQSGLWKGRTLYELYQEAHTPWDWHPALFERAKQRGVPLFSSPFDPSAVELLESLNCPIYKIASFELVDIGLLERVAVTGKPVILSTGMATLDEIDEAVETLRSAGADQLLLLHCTSAYPAPTDQANLRAIPMLRKRYGLPIGLSDHTVGDTVPVAAVALGACLVEKHFVTGADAAVDAAFSLNDEQFSLMASACVRAWQALGEERRAGPTDAERDHLSHRRSLYAVADIPKGGKISENNVRSVRPGNGMHPRELPSLIGLRAKSFIAKGTPLTRNLLDDGSHD